MASVKTRWWGVIVELNRDEACFAATGIDGYEYLMAAIPPPWNVIVVAAVKLHKIWIGRNVGTNGADMHFNWAGFLHNVKRRGPFQSCG